jgi:hypothetical protein
MRPGSDPGPRPISRNTITSISARKAMVSDSESPRENAAA